MWLFTIIFFLAYDTCSKNKFEINFCDTWCNTEGKWGCGDYTFIGCDFRNTDNSDYNCSCDGCNGCSNITILLREKHSKMLLLQWVARLEEVKQKKKRTWNCILAQFLFVFNAPTLLLKYFLNFAGFQKTPLVIWIFTPYRLSPVWVLSGIFCMIKPSKIKNYRPRLNFTFRFVANHHL